MSGDALPAIVGIALVAAAAAFVLLPFTTSRTAASESVQESAPDRFALYQQVLELEFDHELGKLSTADYEQLSAELLTRAGEGLREERGNLEVIDTEIEREIAAARAAFAAARRVSVDPEPESEAQVETVP